MLRLRWLGFLCVLALNGAACSDGSGLMPETSSPQDAAMCTGPLEEVSAGCPATYDGSKPPACARGIDQGWIERCNGLVTLVYYGPAFQLWCSYDDTSHALVGAAELGDSDTYCNTTSPDRRAGRVNAANCPSTDMNEALSCVPAVTASSGPTVCTGPMDEVSAGCAATYDGTQANLPACASNSSYVRAQTCGDDLLVVAIGNPIMGTECFYDTASHALVGATKFLDTNSFCAMSSSNQSAGRVSSCGDTPFIATRSCP
jgi:hypothetical protein